MDSKVCSLFSTACTATTFDAILNAHRGQPHPMPEAMQNHAREHHVWYRDMAAADLPSHFQPLPASCSFAVSAGYPKKPEELDNLSTCPMFHGVNNEIEDGGLSPNWYNIVRSLDMETKQVMCDHILLFTLSSGLHDAKKAPIWTKVFGFWGLYSAAKTGLREGSEDLVDTYLDHMVTAASEHGGSSATFLHLLCHQSVHLQAFMDRQKAIAAENEESQGQCLICAEIWDSKVIPVLLPVCGHAGVCAGCIAQLRSAGNTTCPIPGCCQEYGTDIIFPVDVSRLQTRHSSSSSSSSATFPAPSSSSSSSLPSPSSSSSSAPFPA